MRSYCPMARSWASARSKIVTVARRTALRIASLMLATAPSASHAQDAEIWPPPGVSFHGDAAAPDISGVWLGSKTGVPGEKSAPNRGSADGSPETFWSPWPLPYRPAFQKIISDRAKALGEGRALGDTRALCLPFGMPRMLVAKVYPDEIVQTPGQVSFYMYGSVPIVVWTDGRSHPADLKPSFNGHSIGYWVGDTLTVETIGFNNRATLDHNLNPHSDKLTLRWLVRRVATDTLHVHVTLDDDEAFFEPVTTTNIWRRKTDPRWQVLDDGSCYENNRTAVDEQGNTDGFIKF